MLNCLEGKKRSMLFFFSWNLEYYLKLKFYNLYITTAGNGGSDIINYPLNDVFLYKLEEMCTFS